MQNALTIHDALENILEEHDIQMVPPRCYIIYRGGDGKKIYIPMLKARGYADRLSRKMFKRAQAAQDHAVAFHKRFIIVKEAAICSNIQTRED